MQHTTDTSAANRPVAWEQPALASGIVFALSQIAQRPISSPSWHLICRRWMRRWPSRAPSIPTTPRKTRWSPTSLYLVSVPFFLVFLGGLFSVLRRLEGGVGVLTATSIGAGIAVAMIWPIGIVVADSGQGLARQGLEPLTVMAFDGVAQLMLALSAFPRAVLLLGASLGLLSAASAPLDHSLEVEIRDDGVGLPDNRIAGIGLRSMRERAEELGGDCRVERLGASMRGTRVVARLPLGTEYGDV